MDLREMKALEIAARSRITFNGTYWLVPSQSSPTTTYPCTFGERPSCTCEDWTIRQPTLCKHIIAAPLTSERDHGGAAPKIHTAGGPAPKTYTPKSPRHQF